MSRGLFLTLLHPLQWFVPRALEEALNCSQREPHRYFQPHRLLPAPQLPSLLLTLYLTSRLAARAPSPSSHPCGSTQDATSERPVDHLQVALHISNPPPALSTAPLRIWISLACFFADMYNLPHSPQGRLHEGRAICSSLCPGTQAP